MAQGKSWGRSASAVVSVVILSITLSLSSNVSLGMNYPNRAFWTYEMSAEVEAMGIRTNVSGEVTFTYEGRQSIDLKGKGYDANTIDIKGSLTGSAQLLGQSTVTASFAVDGTQYEDRLDLGPLERDMILQGSVTFTAGLISFTNSIVDYENVTTVPSLLAGFDPSAIQFGSSWSTSVNETLVQSILQNQVLVNESSLTRELAYAVTVGASVEPTQTPAGTLNAVAIIASAGAGISQTYWWSSDVGYFAKEEMRNDGSSIPYLSLNLTAFGKGSTSYNIVVPIIGLAVLVVAVAVLLIELEHRRRPPEIEPKKEGSAAVASYEPETSQANTNR